MKPPHPQILSYGGGLQSVAMCLLVAQERLERPTHIICADTGREAQSTWDYLAGPLRPVLARAGLCVEIAGHDLARVDLYARDGQTLLPAWTSTGRLSTYCSVEWKRRVIQRALRALGYKGAMTWIGFTLDERHRVKQTDDAPWYQRYPLLELMLTRADCERIVSDAGLPLPAKSACYMCPHRTNAEWRHIRDHYPSQWAQAQALDDEIRVSDERDGLYLHRSRRPLAMAPIDEPEQPDAERQCGLGLCFL